MAYNYDKLVKAQDEFKKPKFALDVINRHLKKRPADPYVIAWKAKVNLQQDVEPSVVVGLLQPLCQRQPPIADVPLLAYIYRHLLEATRRWYPAVLNPPSVGEAGIKAWQNLAKTLSNSKQRLDLWSDLFVVAMEEDCWEDVRYALIAASKEGPKNTKTVYYTTILANQLSVEQKARSGMLSTQMFDILKELPLKQMRKAFDSNPQPTEDAVCVRDMRDFKFMVTVYQRQKRLKDLVELWFLSSPATNQFLHKFKSQLTLQVVQAAKESEDWKTLLTVCMSAIGWALDEVDAQSSIRPLKVLCTTHWPVIKGFIDATEATCSSPTKAKNSVAIVSTRFSRAIAHYPKEEDRSLRLAAMYFGFYIGPPNPLSNCKEYWVAYFENGSCFKDMRPLVARLPFHEQRDFHSFVREKAASFKLAAEGAHKDQVRWLRAEASVLAFEYMMIISTLQEADKDVIEVFVANALRLYQIALVLKDESRWNIIFLVIVGNLKLQELFQHEGPYQFQATIFVRHILSDPAARSMRQLNLISTRLHLLIGLGTIAFQHYGYCKVKEMLHDTLSWVLLTRISLTHPYPVDGFSADDELDKVIRTIERMEKKTDDHLYHTMQTFFWDTAIDMLELKRKLRSSLTKHMCMIERRRIARLQGKVPDRDLDLNFRDYFDISDNQDFKVIPNYGFEDHNEGVVLLTPSVPILPQWIFHYYHRIEVPSRLAYNEPLPPGYLDTVARLAKEQENIDDSPFHGFTEDDFCDKWYPAGHLAHKAFGIPLVPVTLTGKRGFGSSSSSVINSIFDRLNEQLTKILDNIDLQTLDMTEEDPSDPLWSEDTLHWAYGLLEFLRMLVRLCVRLSQIAKSKKDPEITTAIVMLLELKIREVFDSLHRMIEGDITLIQTRGEEVLRKMARKGPTGEVLRDIIDDEHLNAYVRDYVKTAEKTVRCVLKVQLGT